MGLLRFRFIPTWRGQRDEALPWSEASLEALSLALGDSDQIVRQQAAHALSRFGAPRAAMALGNALTDEDPLVRLWSARALGRSTASTTEELIEALLQATGDPSDTVRVEATTALGRLGRPDELPGKLIADPSFHVRRSWAAAVATGSTEAQHEGLQRLLKDPVGEVAAAAVTSLIRRGEGRRCRSTGQNGSVGKSGKFERPLRQPPRAGRRTVCNAWRAPLSILIDGCGSRR